MLNTKISVQIHFMQMNKQRKSRITPKHTLLLHLKEKLEHFKRKSLKPILKPTNLSIKVRKNRVVKNREQEQTCFIPLKQLNNLNPEFERFIKQKPFESRQISERIKNLARISRNQGTGIYPKLRCLPIIKNHPLLKIRLQNCEENSTTN